MAPGAAAREIKTHAPHCRVIFTVYEMKQLDRDSAELMDSSLFEIRWHCAT